MLIKNDNIKTFLYVLVSPSACNKELIATTTINNIDPENIIFVYWRPRFVTYSEEPINSNISPEKLSPIKVIIIEINTPK